MLAVMLVLALVQDTPEALVEKLVGGSEDDKKKAAEALVKLGKEARPALMLAHRKHSKTDVRERLEPVILRIDAETDNESGDAGEVKVSLLTSSFEIEIPEDMKEKMLHIRIPITFENSGAAKTAVLKRATFHTVKGKAELAVTGADRRNFQWDIGAKDPRRTFYNNLITAKWKEGTLVVAVLEFDLGGKTLKLRTPVATVRAR